MTDMTPEEVLRHGREADSLQGNETLKLALKLHRQNLLDQIANSAPENQTERENCYREIRAMDGVMGALRAMANNAALLTRKR